MLGEKLDGELKKYVHALRDAGTPIGSSVVMAAGEGIIRAHDRTLLLEHGGHMQPTKIGHYRRGWGLKRKATTKATPSMSTEEFEKVKATFLKQVADSLIINLDQTGIKLVPCGDWTMAAEVKWR